MDNYLPIFTLLIIVLIIVHAVISRRKGSHENNDVSSGHWAYTATLLISILLLLFYSTGVCWLLYSDMSWPHVGSLSIVPLFVLCPGIIFQIFFLTYALTKRKLPARRIRVRLFSILFGLILAVYFMNSTQKKAMENFELNYEPLIKVIQSNFPSPCNPKIPYAEHEQLQRIKNMGHLRYDKEHFILTFHGRSADVDGSTIYYFSKEGRWAIFHNDKTEELNHLEELTKGMRDCQGKVYP